VATEPNDDPIPPLRAEAYKVLMERALEAVRVLDPQRGASGRAVLDTQDRLDLVDEVRLAIDKVLDDLNPSDLVRLATDAVIARKIRRLLDGRTVRYADYATSETELAVADAELVDLLGMLATTASATEQPDAVAPSPAR